MTQILTFIIFLCIFLLVMIIFREVALWYWRINAAIGLLTEIRDVLYKGLHKDIPAKQKEESDSLPWDWHHKKD